jgi:hypothetical protein
VLRGLGGAGGGVATVLSESPAAAGGTGDGAGADGVEGPGAVKVTPGAASVGRVVTGRAAVVVVRGARVVVGLGATVGAGSAAGARVVVESGVAVVDGATGAAVRVSRATGSVSLSTTATPRPPASRHTPMSEARRAVARGDRVTRR